MTPLGHRIQATANRAPNTPVLLGSVVMSNGKVLWQTLTCREYDINDKYSFSLPESCELDGVLQRTDDFFNTYNCSGITLAICT